MCLPHLLHSSDGRVCVRVPATSSLSIHVLMDVCVHACMRVSVLAASSLSSHLLMDVSVCARVPAASSLYIHVPMDVCVCTCVRLAHLYPFIC